MADEKAQEFLRPKTRLNLGKVMKYHPERAEEFFELVTDYQVSPTGSAEIVVLDQTVLSESITLS